MDLRTFIFVLHVYLPSGLSYKIEHEDKYEEYKTSLDEDTFEKLVPGFTEMLVVETEDNKHMTKE